MPKQHNLRYQEVASALKTLIETGTFHPGEKLPSLRMLKETYNISVSTALSAYTLLEQEGLIASRPQSGYYVRSLKIHPNTLPLPLLQQFPQLLPQSVHINDLVMTFFDAVLTARLIPFGAASPDPSLLPLKTLQQLSNKCFKTAGEEALAYDIPPGYLPLREQITRHQAANGITTQADQIITTCGSLEGFTLCLRAVSKPGDTILIQSPTYFGILQALENLSLKALEIPAHPDTGLDLEAVDQALTTHTITACLLIPNFNNPSGSLMPDANKQWLVDRCKQAQIPIIEDDVYGDLYLEGKRPKPLQAFDTEGWVLYVSSFTKTLAPGLRVGWIQASPRFHRELCRLKLMGNVAVNNLAQMTVTQLMHTGHYNRHLKQFRQTLQRNLGHCRPLLQQSFPEGTGVSSPKGGFVLWVSLPQESCAMALYKAALEKQILIAPGALFSPANQWPHAFRLNFALPWHTRLDDAIACLGKLAESL